MDKRIVEILAEKIRALSDYNRNAEIKPQVILWPDKDRKFEPSLDVIQQEMPEVLVLGDYAPDRKTGPAIWLRCAISKTIPIEIPDELVPVIYLPGVEREKLRPENADSAIKPLVPLQYTGRIFSQKSFRDVTPFSFLAKTNEGIGLDIQDSNDLRETLKAALPSLLKMSIDEVKGLHIDADYLNSLLSGGDAVSSLLMYINSGESAFESPEQRIALKRLFKSKYELDLDCDSQLSAAEKLADHKSHEWKIAWNRYQSSYELYGNIEKQIRSCYHEPAYLPGVYVETEEGWPQYNDQQEEILLSQLKDITNKSKDEIITGLEILDNAHSIRIDNVWGRHGESQIARVTSYLNIISRIIKNERYGSSVRELADFYERVGYKVDLYALKALSLVKTDERINCVKNLLSSFYNDYIDNMSRAFQEAVQSEGYPYSENVIKYKKDTCVLFVDGLRYDMAKMLQQEINDDDKYDYQIIDTIFWCPFPSVTPCGKYSVSPIVQELQGNDCDDYGPSFKDSGINVNSTSFKKRLEAKGWQIVEDASIKTSNYGWCSTRSIDELGHQKQALMAQQVDDLIDEIKEKVNELIKAGWKHIRIVTDHGWLLIPNKMPKCELPKAMTESNEGRCAKMIPEVKCEYQQVPWSWNNDQLVAAARGIGSFIDGKEFAHGGLSLEECMTLQLEITTEESGENIEVNDITWKGMACSFNITGDLNEIIADIRMAPNDKASSLADKPKQPDSDGHVRILVTDDDAEGKNAYLVLISNTDESVLYQKQTVIGG